MKIRAILKFFAYIQTKQPTFCMLNLSPEFALNLKIRFKYFLNYIMYFLSTYEIRFEKSLVLILIKNFLCEKNYTDKFRFATKDRTMEHDITSCFPIPLNPWSYIWSNWNRHIAAFNLTFASCMWDFVAMFPHVLCVRSWIYMNCFDVYYRIRKAKQLTRLYINTTDW